MQGLATLGAYLVLFSSVATLLRTRAQLDRLVGMALIVGLPVSLYGIVQHAGLDLLIWDYDVTRRVASTIGNPTFVAGFLIMLMPLAIVRLVTARAMLARTVSGLLVATLLGCIIFTQGRGALIAMCVSLVVLILLVTLSTRGRGKAVMLVVAAVLAVVIAAAVPTSKTLPTPDTSGNTEQGDRLTRLLDTETGSGHVRLLIWEGVENLVRSDAVRMAVGYGPETIKHTLPAYLPPETERASRRSTSDRTHNDLFDILLTSGLIGLIAWILFITGLVLWSLRFLGIVLDDTERRGFVAAWFGLGIAALVGVRLLDGTWRLGGLSFSAGLVGGLLVYLAVSALKRKPDVTSNDRLVMAAIAASIIAHFLDVQVGVASVATRSYFWILAGAIVAIGRGLKPPRAGSDRAFMNGSSVLVGWVVALGGRKSVPVTAAAAGGFLLLRWSGIQLGFEMTAVPVLYLACAVAVVLIVAFLVTAAEKSRTSRSLAGTEGIGWNRRFTPLYLALVAVLAYAMVSTSNSIRADVYLRESGYQASVGQSDLSVLAAEEAVRLDPRRDIYHLNLGRTYLQIGDFARAETALLQAESLAPLDPDHPANLGRLFQHWWQSDRSNPNSNVRVQHALTHFERATNLNPNKPSFWNELALTHLIASDTTAALATLQRSLVLDDKVAETHLQMGNLYRARGDVERAVESYEQAYTFHSDSKIQEALRRRIDDMKAR